ncbi:MAG: phenylalanine--tRNA ligase subunit beta [Erysipelotrichales bacterium]|nr:phenylalanine--tRNA ligase subunit beta [Erysipelotrichales bacterium]
MRLSYNWISELVDLHDINAYKLADMLTTAGFEVEGIEPAAQGTNLVIGEVLECVDHPDSDHLHCTKVNVGDEVLNIVCGAPNCRTGLKVIVAKVGAVLPEITIKKGNIRGQESNGMLCSLRELGVNEKYLTEYQLAGIEELPADAEVGNTEVLKYLGLDDVVLEVGLTPNRADFMAMFSAAKEVSAITGRECKLPVNKKCEKELPATISISSKTEKCPLFLGKYIHNVEIKESPKWMVDRLHACGIKSINNVVDISNYVMLETGQPLHFYDADKNTAKALCAESGKVMEYTALDGVTYHITEDDIVIMSGDNCAGIAGIMGGDDSKIDDTTKSIIIEAASFNAVSIRNSSRRFNLNTDACTRFIKGIEPMAAYKAMERCVDLLMEYAGSTEIEETVEYDSLNYTPTVFDVTLSFINNRLGTHYSIETVVDVLTKLNFAPEVNGETITVHVPSYRWDVSIPEDISEEVIRLVGYDSLESTLPMMPMTLGALNPVQRKRRLVEKELGAMGLTQVLTYTLVSEERKNMAVMPLEGTVTLASCLSEDRKHVRSSVLPSMLEVVSYNLARNANHVNIYEVSSVYGEKAVEERLGMCLYGSLQELPWAKANITTDFYTLKGVIETLLERMGFDAARIMIKENTVDTTMFHPGKSAALYVGKDLVGVFGAIHPTMCKKYDIKEVYAAELKLSVLYDTKVSKVKFTPLPKFPSSKRDLAFVIKNEVAVGKVVEAIKKVNKSMISSVEVFDIYQGEHVEKGYKSVALSIMYQLADKTITDQDILPVQEKIMATLEKEFDAVLRK